uniref:Uncharacterized protein n=1 Tax=Rhodnius prolixus TaxID=13249 RepID=T1I0V2_RHOPR
MPGGIFLYISQVTLSVVSLWTLNLSYGYDFACGGLAMYFLSSSLGLIARSKYLTDTDDLDVRPVHVIHYANILTMLYTGFVRNEEAYLIAHSYVICHHILLPISTVCYNFGLSLLCLNWLIYKHNSSS